MPSSVTDKRRRWNYVWFAVKINICNVCSTRRRIFPTASNFYPTVVVVSLAKNERAIEIWKKKCYIKTPRLCYQIMLKIQSSINCEQAIMFIWARTQLCCSIQDKRKNWTKRRSWTVRSHTFWYNCRVSFHLHNENSAILLIHRSSKPLYTSGCTTIIHIKFYCIVLKRKKKLLFL